VCFYTVIEFGKIIQGIVRLTHSTITKQPIKGSFLSMLLNNDRDYGHIDPFQSILESSKNDKKHGI
jgi:hypothetical protein